MPQTTNLLDNGTVPACLQQWADAVTQGQAAKIAGFYAENAKLKGTVWDGFVDHSAENDGGRTVEDYFVNLQKGRENIRVRWNKIFEIRSGVFAVDYSFVFINQTTKAEEILNADATFIFDEDKDKIILHHSSPARNDN